MAFELLAEPIRKFIHDRRWGSLRAIQRAAIPRILQTDEHYILASRTASGKTEAAFLPILSKVDFRKPGVRVLYISPLIALINDQFLRIDALCGYLDVMVTRWHGEASKSLKDALVAKPEGVLLITPESLEAMLVTAPFKAKVLFGSLDFIVIDEIHSFAGSDRGVQLTSLLWRLRAFNGRSVRVVGLSATIGDYDLAKRITGEPSRTIVLRDPTAKEIQAELKYFEEETVELPLALLKDLYRETCNSRVLIFPNSRGRVEEIAVKLKKISEKVNGHPYYFSHHSSVDKELREYIETFAKTNQHRPYTIACTSTLELGIDIGTVDHVIQVDATHSVSSLIQRVGRSGRREGAVSKLMLYATDPWSLLQSLACWELYRSGYIEPGRRNDRPFDILLHQMLAIVKQQGGIVLDDLVADMAANAAFTGIDKSDIATIARYMINRDHFELLGGELIIGLEGEKLVNSRDFYSVFKTKKDYKVSHAGKTIGELPLSPQLQAGENILLAARIWKILDVDHGALKVSVIPALDGRKPTFMGSRADVHPAIREKMMALIFSGGTFSVLGVEAIVALEALCAEFAACKISDVSLERPVLVREDEIVLYTFTGSHINRSLAFLIKASGAGCLLAYDEASSSFELSVKFDKLPARMEACLGLIEKVDILLEQALGEASSLMDFSRWGSYLPVRYQVQLLKSGWFDFGGVKEFLETVRWVCAE